MATEEQIKLFEKEIKKLLPKCDPRPYRAGNKGNDQIIWNHYHYNIPQSNNNLYKSRYFYMPNKVVHFSNLAALDGIIKNQCLRLYNLNNLNDPREFSFASRLFGIDNETMSDAKNNLFTISFCETPILEKNAKSEFNMWRLYGKNGKGVAIIFSIENDPIKWEDFHISKIIYGAKDRNKFVQFLNFIEEFNKTPPTIDVDFGKLCAFHKSNLFSVEKEVRIVFDRRKLRSGGTGRTYLKYDNSVIFPIIKTDAEKSKKLNSEIKYLELPLFTSHLKFYDKETPLLKIDKIIIGYNYLDETDDIVDKYSELCNNQLGYKPEILQTRLKKFYWDPEIKLK